jgi:hypothetical protein
MLTLHQVESALLRHLHEQLEVPLGIKIFESVFYVDFTTYTKWVVIDYLSNVLGPQAKQLLFLHIAVKKQGQNEAEELAKLVDSVYSVVDQGTRFAVYNYTTGAVIGETEVCEVSLSPVMQHQGGGSYRSLTLGLVY